MHTIRIPSYLSKSRHGIYYVRFATPTSLLRATPTLAREIRKSLNTRDLRDAVVRSRKLVIDFKLSVQKVLAAMTTENDDYTGQFYVGVDKNTGDMRIQFEKGDNPDEVKEHLMMMQALGMLPKNAGITDTMGIDPTPQERQAVKMEYQSQKAGGMWLSELIQSFADEKLSTGAWTKTTWNQTYSPILRDFREIISKAKRKVVDEKGNEVEIWDIHARELDEEYLQKYCRGIFVFPKNYASMKGAGDAKQALASGLPPQSRENAYKKLRMIKTFLRWSDKKKKLSEELASIIPEQVKDKKRDKESDGYQPWTDAELKKIFERQDYPTEGFRYWTPLIALYTGGRANEVAQLQVDDIIKTDSGVTCISIMDLGDDVDEDAPLFVPGDTPNIKSVKTASSRRLVPVHPKLIEAGFLDFVEYMREQGSVRLFPDLKYSEVGGYGRQVSRTFSTVTKKLKIWVAHKKVFHSLRGSFNARLLKNGVHQEMREFLLGHANDSVNINAYGKRLEDRPYEKLSESVKQVDFGLTHKKWEKPVSLPPI